MLVIAAALCESAFNILSKFNSIKALSRPDTGLDPAVQTTLVAATALLFSAFLMIQEHPLQSLTSIGIIEWMALAWYGLFVTALAFIFWYSGIKRCKASSAAVFSGMMPLTSLILSVLLLGERPGWQQWIGGLLVVAGMILASAKGANDNDSLPSSPIPFSQGNVRRGNSELFED